MAYIPQQINQTSAFDELSVTEQSPAVQIIFPYNINLDLVSTSSNGTAYVTASNSKAQINTGAAANQSASLQSKDVLRYQTGQGGLVRYTALFTSGVAGSMQLMGYGDDLSGYYFGYSGSNFGIMRRYNSTEYWTFQSGWSDQKFDGSDTSAMTLNPTKGNVYQIRFQWLGYGAIRWYIENSETGQITLVHTEKYANTNTVPSIPNPSLPIYIEAKNWSNTSNIKVETSSMSGLIEGRLQIKSPVRNTWNWATNATTLTNILTLHNTTTFHGVRNRVRIVPDLLSFSTTGKVGGKVTLIRNPTNITGSHFEVRNGYSVALVCTQSVAPIGGQNIGIYYVGPDSATILDLATFELYIHPGETITIAGTSGDAASPISASISWHEHF